MNYISRPLVYGSYGGIRIFLMSVAAAILEPSTVEKKSLCRFENIQCIDAISVLLFGRLHEVVRVSKSVRAEMKVRHRSIMTKNLSPE